MLMALPLLLILATIIPRAETFAPLPLKTGLLPFQSSSSSQHQHQHQHQPLLLSSLLKMSATTGTSNSDAETTTTGNVDVDVDVVVVDRSTLTLLEHVNLNVPSHEHILPFYFGLLGCGMDPRKAANLAPDAAKKTLWANCGASQFHLPYGVTAQRIPGHVGLRFRDLQGLEGRLEAFKAHYASAERGKDPGTGRDYIRITDHYGNVFVCRAREMSEDGSSSSSSSSSTTSSNAQQPFIRPDETEKWGEVATTYGRLETECRGIDYVEFSCPMGMASKIALFYESVLDATTTVVDTGTNGSSIAIIAVGNVDEQGRTDQSILFRETTEPIAEYDGHHIALYVGETAADFEQAFKNANLANIVWCNPRFQDQADTLDEARKEQQFRFKNIVDMETGETIMELEHELRSIQHPSWPGKLDE